LFLLAAAAAFSVAEIVSGVLPGFVLTAIALVPCGLAMLSITTAANSHVQLGVAPMMRGRVMSLYLICFLGGTPLGAPVIGWLAEVAGPRWGLIGGGVVCLVCVAGLGAFLARRRGMAPGEIVSLVAARAHAA
jgi:MFS family permease